VTGFEDLDIILRWAEGAEVPDLDGALTRLSGPERAMAERLVALGRRRREFARQLVHTAKLSEVGLALAQLVHDMRQPLSAISGFAQLWLEHPADSEARAWVGEIRVQATRLEQMIERLRRFVRRSEEPSTAPRDDAAQAAREAASLFHKLPPGTRLTLEISRDPMPQVVAERGALQQVFFNLLGNARDALEGREQGSILLRVEPFEGGVRALVADDGTGIPPEVRGRLFEPFVTSKGEAGTGLGLFICRELVAAHGGSILEVEPAPAPFSTAFAVVLKAAPEPAENRARAPRGPSVWSVAKVISVRSGPAKPAFALSGLPPRTPAADVLSQRSMAAAAQLAEEIRAAASEVMPGRRVLVADEHPAMRRAMRVLLADVPSLEVLEAGNAASATAALDGAPALLVLERSLEAGVSGLEILRLARARNLGVEALIVTGQPSIRSALDALELGVGDFLIKPLEPVEQLRVRVRELLARQRRRLLLRSLDSKVRVWAERALSMPPGTFPPGRLLDSFERLAARPEGPGLFLVLEDAKALELIPLSGHRALGPVRLAGAPAALMEGRCDALFLGPEVPTEAALDLTAQARSLAWPVPVIWSAPMSRFETAVQAIRAGAGALTLRSADPKSFAPMLSNVLRAHREETRALALGRALEELDIGWE
jgi:signal transduction histidine kinase/DNA-binding NarL/FixJ family response regulator